MSGIKFSLLLKLTISNWFLYADVGWVLCSNYFITSCLIFSVKRILTIAVSQCSSIYRIFKFLKIRGLKVNSCLCTLRGRKDKFNYRPFTYKTFQTIVIKVASWDSWQPCLKVLGFFFQIELHSELFYYFKVETVCKVGKKCEKQWFVPEKPVLF